MSQPAVLQVVILRDGLLVGTEVLVPGTYSVGSGADCELRLEDPTVSVAHAVLYFQNNRAAIQDNASHTGVYVNGHKVSACEIRSVDEVLLGPFVLKVRVLEKKAQPAKPQPPPEVAALLKTPPGGGQRPSRPSAPAVSSPPPPAVSRPGPVESTVASARRLQAVPQSDVPTPTPQRAPHLKAVALDEERPTESLYLPDTVFDEATNTVPGGIPRTTPNPTAVMRPIPLNTMEVTAPGVAPPAVRREARGQGASSSHLGPAPRISRAQLDSKKEPKLYFELYWGAVRKEARSFTLDKKGVQAAADELAQMPLWGFSLPETGLQLAEPAGNSFRVFVPPRADVERGQVGQLFEAATAEGRGGQKFVTLSNGQAARFTEGEMALVAYVAPPPEKIFVNPLKGLPWLAIALQLFFGGGALGFILFGPKPAEMPDFDNKTLPAVAVKLIAPEKKEKAKAKLEQLKKKAQPKKKETAVAKKEKEIEKKVPQVVKAAPETKALKALAKLSAAGPMKDLLAATDKLGAGPGDKRVKNSDYKLSGLIGKAPIANAGVGLFGLGGGGKGGGATLGMEVLRGKGGGGIGALGAGRVGKGAVGGMVTRASARSIKSSGSIDREAVAKTVNSHLQEVRACYERALLKDPSLAGKVVLEWTISTSGTVTTAKTKTSTLRNSSVESCILSSLKTWKFPAAKGGQVIVSYPFMFNSVGY